MLWSSVSIAGRPSILMVDASCDLEGWESEFCGRLYASMRRRNLLLKGSGPARVEKPQELAEHLEPQEAYNCILLFGHGEGEAVPPGTGLRSYWTWLSSWVALTPKLLAVCMWESYDPVLSQEILESSQSFAPLALAPQSPLAPREAGLYFLKFFTELNLHSGENISGRMVWFSGSKARELLRRRRLTGQFGVRC